MGGFHYDFVLAYNIRDLPQPDDTFAAREVNAVAEKNPDPLNLNRRPRRILRASPLVPVATIC